MPFNSTYLIANKAKDYSRKYIIKGSTQITNNTYDALRRNALSDGVLSVRRFYSNDSKFSLELNNKLKEFYRTIELCKKFSIGNCYELALMALDYVIQEAPGINAEVFRIEGGDHRFLVVGRKKDSNPSEPNTWGDAYICDPWANKVYPAKEYSDQLKSYYCKDVIKDGEWTYQNCEQDFDPTFHRLMPVANENTNYIRKVQSIEHIGKINRLFEEKAKSILVAIDKLNNNLLEISIELEKKYGKEDDKRAVILSMITHLHKAREEITTLFNKTDFNQDYLEYRTELEGKLKNSVHLYSKAVTLNEDNRNTLYRYKNPEKFKTKLQCFFKINPNSVKKTNAALKEAKKDIEDALNKGPK